MEQGNKVELSISLDKERNTIITAMIPNVGTDCIVIESSLTEEGKVRHNVLIENIWLAIAKFPKDALLKWADLKYNHLSYWEFICKFREDKIPEIREIMLGEDSSFRKELEKLLFENVKGELA